MFELRSANSTAMRRATRLLALVVALALGSGMSVTANASPRDVVDVPVAFQVQNTNTSRDPCPSDAKSYVVRGHLTGPRAAVLGPGPRAMTLYYEGFDSGEWMWRFRVVPGYDYAAEMAKLGQTSVTVDQVGYGASGHPQGNDTCIGAQADIAHQIIGQLRSGTYSAAGTSPVKFEKVVLGIFADASARCAAGGEPAYPGGPGGYVYYPQLSDWPTLMPNSDPDVIAGAIASRQRNPCGLIPSTATTEG